MFTKRGADILHPAFNFQCIAGVFRFVKSRVFALESVQFYILDTQVRPI
jgi:hypothetical protein